jgi:hypothetical protein
VGAGGGQQLRERARRPARAPRPVPRARVCLNPVRAMPGRPSARVPRRPALPRPPPLRGLAWPGCWPAARRGPSRSICRSVWLWATARLGGGPAAPSAAPQCPSPSEFGVPPSFGAAARAQYRPRSCSPGRAPPPGLHTTHSGGRDGRRQIRATQAGVTWVTLPACIYIQELLRKILPELPAGRTVQLASGRVCNVGGGGRGRSAHQPANR